MPRLTLEVIAIDVADAEAAERGGADRIELVVDLPHGGLTPPLELVDAVLARVSIPVRVMVRESEGHEIETPELRDCLHAIAREVAARPVHGLVLGFLRRGRVDRDLLASILAASAPRRATFHRAFDAAADQDVALADSLGDPGGGLGADFGGGRPLGSPRGETRAVGAGRWRRRHPGRRGRHTGAASRDCRHSRDPRSPRRAGSPGGGLGPGPGRSSQGRRAQKPARPGRRRLSRTGLAQSGRGPYTAAVTSSPGIAFVRAILAEYGRLRALGEAAVGQVDDRQFGAVIDAGGNSLAILMKHVGGNLRSRWEDFRTTDGEKPDRHRDGEFETGEPRDAIEAVWAHGWGVLESAVGSMTDDDLERDVVIRGERVSLPAALARSLAHTAGHVHQMVLLARHWKGADWRTLSIPRRQSEEFRRRMLTHSGDSV